MSKKSQTEIMLRGLMDTEKFGFCVMHYNNNYGYVQGTKFGMVEICENEEDINIYFVDNDTFTPMMIDYINKNYDDYKARILRKGEMAIKYAANICLRKPLSAQIIDKGERLRVSAIKFLIFHPFFAKNGLNEINIPCINDIGKETEIKLLSKVDGYLYVTLIDGTQISIEDLTIDTLLYLVSLMEKECVGN
jgi:hypothetical protein